MNSITKILQNECRYHIVNKQTGETFYRVSKPKRDSKYWNPVLYSV